MKAFQVPRREVAVRVSLDGGDKIEGRLYAAAERPGGGPGLLTERLNDPSESFVALGASPGGWLLSKARIVAVHLVSGEEEAALLEREGLRHLNVRVVLRGGEQLEGEIAYGMPEGRQRLVDYLNESERFFAIRRGVRVALVNREQVVRVQHLDAEPD